MLQHMIDTRWLYRFVLVNAVRHLPNTREVYDHVNHCFMSTRLDVTDRGLNDQLCFRWT